MWALIPQSIAVIRGMYLNRFSSPTASRLTSTGFRLLTPRNVFSASTLDQMPKQLSSGLMFGHWLSIAVPDLPRCDFLLVLGANPLASNGSVWTVPDVKKRLKTVQKRGGQVVVIDPRRTETAKQADIHLQLRPGTDAFLMSAILAIIVRDNLHDRDFLARHCHGFEAIEADQVGAFLRGQHVGQRAGERGQRQVGGAPAGGGGFGAGGKQEMGLAAAGRAGQEQPVTRLAARARTHRVAHGRLAVEGIELLVGRRAQRQRKLRGAHLASSESCGRWWSSSRMMMDSSTITISSASRPSSAP